MLTSVVSLTICLAMTSAFVLRAPMVSPQDPAWRKQASATLGVPLGGDGRWVGAGGALSKRGGNEATEAKKKWLPHVLSAEGYIALRSRSTSPLHAFKGAEVRPYPSVVLQLYIRPNFVFRVHAKCKYKFVIKWVHMWSLNLRTRHQNILRDKS